MKYIKQFIIFMIVFTNMLYANNNINNIYLQYVNITDTKNIKQTIASINKNSQDFLKSFILGLLYHNLAMNSNKLDDSNEAIKYLEQSLNQYEQTYNKDPYIKDNSIIITYLGSSYTLLGRDSKRIAQRVSSVNKGLGFMDRAVIIDDNNENLRIVRLENNILLPEMFARSKKIMEDVKFLENKWGNNPSPKERILLQNAYYQLALLEKNGSDNIKIYLDKAYNYLPNSNVASEIKKMVK